MDDLGGKHPYSWKHPLVDWCWCYIGPWFELLFVADWLANLSELDTDEVLKRYQQKAINDRQVSATLPKTKHGLVMFSPKLSRASWRGFWELIFVQASLHFAASCRVAPNGRLHLFDTFFTLILGMQANLNGTQNVSRPRWLNTQLFHSFLKETSFFGGILWLYCILCMFFFKDWDLCPSCFVSSFVSLTWRGTRFCTSCRVDGTPHLTHQEETVLPPKLCHRLWASNSRMYFLFCRRDGATIWFCISFSSWCSLPITLQNNDSIHTSFYWPCFENALTQGRAIISCPNSFVVLLVPSMLKKCFELGVKGILTWEY